MSMEQFPKKEIETLWAPWRVEYFEKETRDMELLTAAARASDDAAHLVITRRKTAFLMMNRYPYSVGHLMAVPYRRTAELWSLGENEIVELWNLVTHAQALLRAATRAQGFNVGLNLGECAGAGVVDHLHIHIVPRWKGEDRKSTRLNSSHSQSSYAVFCLKKKNWEEKVLTLQTIKFELPFRW